MRERLWILSTWTSVKPFTLFSIVFSSGIWQPMVWTCTVFTELRIGWIVEPRQGWCMMLHSLGDPWCSPGLNIWPALLNTFIDDLHKGIECTLNKFAGNTKLSRKVGLQRDLDRLHEWAKVNFVWGSIRPDAESCPWFSTTRYSTTLGTE